MALPVSSQLGAPAQTLHLAGGCFWGMEELFRNQPGVIDTDSGYMGGENDNPTYAFHPGHAESLRIVYDASVTSIDRLLDYFFRIHDPTTKDRQGNDVGSSYRSAIFYTDETEKSAAEQAIVRNQTNWSDPIVTRLESFDKFWPAEPEHQDYLQKNPGGYTCHFERDF